MILEQTLSFFSVVIADIFLAGDNALIIGLVASTIAPKHRRRVIIIGIAMAALMRIVFALGAAQLLHLPGVLVFAGVLLLWIAWKFYRDIQTVFFKTKNELENHPRSIKRAIFQIALADLSMSLDNVLAVAGIAWEHPWIMIFGLVFSIVLMAVGTPIIVKILERYPKVAYGGLAVILYIGITMIWNGLTILLANTPL